MSAFEDIEKAKSLIATRNRIEARKLLSSLVQTEPINSTAWYLLSHVVETNEQAIYCLERAVKIDPLNQQIQERLKMFQQQRRPAQAISTPAFATPSGPAVNIRSEPRVSDQPIYSIIVMLSILVLLWLAIGLLQITASLAVVNDPTSGGICIVGLWNILATLINGYLLFRVIQKKKSAINPLYFLSAAGALFGAFQLLAGSAFIQACAIPLYLGVGFFTYVEKDKFTN